MGWKYLEFKKKSFDPLRPKEDKVNCLNHSGFFNRLRLKDGLANPDLINDKWLTDKVRDSNSG